MEEQEQKPPVKIKIKKSKHHHGGHHGGSWKVAYADFVTAMMALFLVLWLVSQGDQKLKESIANYFRSPGVFKTVQGGLLHGSTKIVDKTTPLSNTEEDQPLIAAATALREKFAKLPQFAKYKDQIKIEFTKEGLRIEIIDKAEQVSFRSGSAELTPAAKEILREVATAICDLSNLIHIGGHTDAHVYPDGSTYTNWELSSDRANAARRELEADCVKKEQLQRIIGYANTQPLDTNNPFAPANRRISILLLYNRYLAQNNEPEDDTPDNQNIPEGLKTPHHSETDPAQAKPVVSIQKPKPIEQKVEQTPEMVGAIDKK